MKSGGRYRNAKSVTGIKLFFTKKKQKATIIINSYFLV